MNIMPFESTSPSCFLFSTSNNTNMTMLWSTEMGVEFVWWCVYF
jgi:hypothetical protein